jgi:hypothetical protein
MTAPRIRDRPIMPSNDYTSREFRNGSETGKNMKRGIWTAAALIAAAACLCGAVAAGSAALAESTREPTQAELTLAGNTGLARLWQRETAGQLFPATIGYDNDDGARQTAARLAISPATDCTTAVDHTLMALAVRYHCQAGLRASYADQPRGTVYTIGVLAFPGAAQAKAFYAALPQPAFPATGLNALAVPGTAAARFGDAARQLALWNQAGPYVVLAVAGYADGRPAAATGEQDTALFGPEDQLIYAVLPPSQVRVDCADTAEWSC